MSAWVHRPPSAMRALVVLLGLMMTATSAVAGDIETAKKNLERAKEEFKDKNWNSLPETLNNIEPFLDGVPDAEKAPVLKELADLRKAAEPQIKAMKAKGIVDRVTRLLDGAADEVQAVPERAATDLKDAADRLATDEAKQNIDADTMKKLQSRLAGLQSMATGGLKKRALDRVNPILKELEDKVAADPFKGKSQDEAYRIGQDLDSLSKRVRGGLSDLPKDDADVKAILAKVDALDKKIEMSANAGEKAEAIANIDKWWKSTKEYFKGWEAETQTPDWQRWTHEGSTDMSSMLMPKTLEAMNRTKYFLKEDRLKEAMEKYKGDASLQAIVDDATKTLDTAAGKFNTAFNKLLDEAEKLPTPTDSLVLNKPGYMENDVDRFFTNTKYHDANMARVKKLDAKWKGAIEGANAAAKELFDKLTAKATAAWPGIASSIKAEDGFNPAEVDKWKGKTVKLTGYNRSGWDYSAQYDFAMAINGIPVAGNYAPNVRAAFDDVSSRTKMSPDDHEKWELIATVQGPGKIKERVNADVRDGSTKIGTIEGTRQLDCAVIQIIAIHAGPVAVGPSGAVNETGAIAQPVASGGSSGGAGTAVAGAASTTVGVIGWIGAIIWFLIGLAAAAVAFLKSKQAPVAQPVVAGDAPAAGGTLNYASPTPSQNDLLSYAGLAFGILGLIHLLTTCVFGDLIPSVALIAAGVYGAADFLKAKNILKPPMYDKLKPLGIPIAGACAFFALLHLFLGHWWFL